MTNMRSSSRGSGSARRQAGGALKASMTVKVSPGGTIVKVPHREKHNPFVAGQRRHRPFLPSSPPAEPVTAVSFDAHAPLIMIASGFRRRMSLALALG
jgi:hypothetical protein